MTFLSCLIIQLLWAFCVEGQGRNCSRPPVIENGDITTFVEKEYTSGSFVEFKCQKLYVLEGEKKSFCDNGKWTNAPVCLEPCAISVKEMENHTVELTEGANQYIWQWIFLKRGDSLELRCKSGYVLATASSQSTFMVQCNENPIVYPECRAPCNITQQQLEDRNLLLSNGQRHTNLIQSEQTVEFTCSEGYTLITPAVRMCVNGHLDLPSCISEAGKKCNQPPVIEHGDITSFLEKEYSSGSSVEFKCQKFYALEGYNTAFCDNGYWTKAPVCLEPCAISVEEMRNQTVELNESANEDIPQWIYLKRGDLLELRCRSGYSLATNPSESTFKVQCNGKPIIYPECREIVCDIPRVVNGKFRPQRNKYWDGDVIIITCNHGFHNHNGQTIAECTKNGWFPPPRCNSK